MEAKRGQNRGSSGQPEQVGGKLEIDAFTLLIAKVDALTQRLD